MPLSLGALVCLPLESRAAFIERFGRHDLVATIEALKQADSPSAAAVTPARIAWALGFNIRDPADPAGTSSGAINPRFAGAFSNRRFTAWSLDTPWEVVWDFYVTPFDALIFKDDERRPAARTFLRELARSVACEQCDAWPWSAQAVDRTLAAECLNEVFQLSNERVRGTVIKRVGSAAAADEIINMTAERAIASAWGEAAGHRFVAKSLITSWLCAIALHTASNQERAESRRRRRQESWSDEHSSLLVVPHSSEGEDALPPDGRTNEDLARRLRACVEHLPGRDRVLLGELLEGLTPAQIAKARGTTPPTISQHQLKVLKALRRCFSERPIAASSTTQQALKAMRGALVSVGADLFPFLKKHWGREP